MNVLVTGATSGLGRNAAEQLLRQGWQVRATGRDEAQGRELQELGASFHRADLATLSPGGAADLVRGVDAVWHCAALSSPWGRMQDFEATNVRATQLLAHASVQEGVPRFVHISTPSIYFDFRHHAQVQESYRAARFANAYAATKACAEVLITGMARRCPNTRFVILRPRALFGPHDRVILPRLLALLHQRRGVLPLPGGGRAVMDLTYVENVVHAMQLATTADVPSGEAFNITNQQPCSLADLLRDLLGGHWGMTYRIQPVPYPVLAGVAGLLSGWARITGREPALTRYSVGALHYGMTLDNSKAQQQLGYFPTIDMTEGVRRTARWHQDHGQHPRF